MNWVIGLSILIIAIYLINYQIRRRKLLILKKHLKNNWGKTKVDGYYNFDVIDQYFQNSKKRETAFHIISDQTKDDLDINDLFKYLDRTSSRIGQQYLYYKLRVVQSQEDLTRFAALNSIFDENVKTRTLFQRELSTLNKVKDYKLEELTHLNIPKEPKTAILLYILSIAAFAALGLSFSPPSLGQPSRGW